MKERNLKNPYRFWIMMTISCLVGLIVSIFFHFSQSHSPKYISQTLALPEINTEPPAANEEEVSGWKTVTTRKGDTLGKLFHRQGLSQQTLIAILRGNPYAKQIIRIKPDQPIQFLIHEDVLEKMILHYSPTHLLIISLDNDHYITKMKARTMDTHQEYVTTKVVGSLYGSAARAKIPTKLVRQMVDILHWDIDFSREVKTGDQFTISYEAQYIDDKLVNTGDVLAVSYTSHGQVHQAIRYHSPNGGYDYYTPSGNSLKKAFSRYPLQFSHISSTFSLSRRHPILHYSRPHKGVDLAAPIGTPIRATGDGRIVQIGRQNAYGNMIKIEHSNMYASLYGHLLRFQKGLSRGMHVKRGQIIGYVGQSGLATGPHCHYEFHVNHQPRNPTTITLPVAAPISAKNKLAFQRTASSLLGSLKLYESAHMLAYHETHSSKTG